MTFFLKIFLVLNFQILRTALKYTGISFMHRKTCVVSSFDEQLSNYSYFKNVESKDETQTQSVRRSPRKHRITVTDYAPTSEQTNSTTRRTRQAKKVSNESPTIRSTTAFERTTTASRRGGRGKNGANDDPAPFSTPAGKQTSKSQSYKKQAKKRSINDLNETNAPNNKWSDEASEKKRKLSNIPANETIAQTNGKICQDEDILW